MLFIEPMRITNPANEVTDYATHFSALLAYLASLFFLTGSVHLEVLASEHPLAVYQRSVRRALFV